MSDNNNNLSGKGKKAYYSIEALEAGVSRTNDRLNCIAKMYDDFLSKDLSNGTKHPKKGLTTRNRTAIDGLPEWREFKTGGLKFYIDFTLALAKESTEQDIEGIIIYGTSRTRYSKQSHEKEENMDNKSQYCKLCAEILKEDMVEYKPLLTFTVNEHYVIRSADLDDKWWIRPTKDQQNKKDAEDFKNLKDQGLLDLHYRAINHIWADAVDWTNEIILP